MKGERGERRAEREKRMRDRGFGIGDVPLAALQSFHTT
jgi:hypothetical protein